MKRLSTSFFILAILISNIMSAFVAYKYCDFLWAEKYSATSAPATVAFLYLIPFIIVIGICITLSLIFLKKEKR